MANDLISRSALIEKFDDATIEIKMDLPIQEILGEDVDIEDFFMLAQEIVQQYRKMAIDTIQKQPIAYDVEKVVERFNSHHRDYYYDEAIDIVEEGWVYEQKRDNKVPGESSDKREA